MGRCAIHGYVVNLKLRPHAAGTRDAASDGGRYLPMDIAVEIRKVDRTPNSISTSWDNGIDFVVPVPYPAELVPTTGLGNGVLDEQTRYHYKRARLKALSKAFEAYLPAIFLPDTFELISSEERLNYADARALLAISRERLLKQLDELRAKNKPELNADITRFCLIHELPGVDPNDFAALLEDESELFDELKARRVKSANHFLTYYALHSTSAPFRPSWKKLYELFGETWNPELGLMLLGQVDHSHNKRVGSLLEVAIKNMSDVDSGLLEKAFIGSAPSEGLREGLFSKNPSLFVDLTVKLWGDATDAERKHIADISGNGPAHQSNRDPTRLSQIQVVGLMQIFGNLEDPKADFNQENSDILRPLVAFALRCSQQLEEKVFEDLYLLALRSDVTMLTNQRLTKFRPAFLQSQDLKASGAAVRELINRSKNYKEFPAKMFELAGGDEALLTLSMIQAFKYKKQDIDETGVVVLCDAMFQMANKSEWLERSFISFVDYCRKERILDWQIANAYLKRLYFESASESTKWGIAGVFDFETIVAWMNE